MKTQNLLLIRNLLELYKAMGIFQIPHFIAKESLTTDRSNYQIKPPIDTLSADTSSVNNQSNTAIVDDTEIKPLNNNLTDKSFKTKTTKLLHTNDLQQNIINKYEFLNAITSLDELKSALNNFNDCDLKKTAMNTVFGVGNSNANIMLIGEAPGANEDITGEPFVGRSGKLLMKALNSIGLNRENLFITNTVFWRPPANRNPTIEEMMICYPFLLKMINLIKPKIIILVGKVATNNILKLDAPISKIRGLWYNISFSLLKESIKVDTIVVFHPAYLLRNSSKKQILWQDLITIMNKINELKL